MFFKRNGQFSSKIKFEQLKIGYPSPHFAVDPKNNYLYITSILEPNRIFTFDFNGKLIKSILIQDKISFLTKIEENFAFINLENAKESNQTDTGYRISIIGQNGELIDNQLPYEFQKSLNGLDLVNSNYKIHSSSKNGVLFTSPLSYDISEINYKKSYTYKFLFPNKYSLPLDILTNENYKNKRFDYLNNNPDRIYKLENVYRCNNLIFFEIINLGILHKNRSLFLNIESGKYYSLNRIKPDSLFYNLPIFNGGKIVGSNNEEIFVEIPSLFLTNKKNLENIDNKNLRDFLKKNSPNENPVIAILALKNVQ